ncbi:MAG: transglutaminase family protein [Acidimicrobiales bacterium]|nr:transglutaminase family protein [Acidimicrobiales bacterium]MXY01300.1 transglutaminase family protein [Acidimicrobiales bacterium]MYB82384.1 transglutaminase family protein [Acidimicrobiales bacterium]MYG88295.1 transglutaminase family protein [Acidimicrobiales bacterium]MYI10937.1 transglutaminase family protein [Acidimicrobiales bacterium]
MRLDIAYRLHFTYAEPVSESQNEIRVRPRDDLRQQVLSYRLTTTPATRVLQTRDYFGTTVDHLGMRAPHDDLLVVAEASVETTPADGAPAPVSCERLSDQQFVNSHIEYLAPSQHVQWGELVNEVASWAVRSAADDVCERVLAVAQAVPTVLTYERGSTAIGVTLEELIDGGRGVCQDFAHLAVGMLRCTGIPARYVSGYLFALDETRPDHDADGDSDSTAISVQTHAWIEAAVPGYGWHALDPTNGGPVGERHVVIGYGRDYNDIPPVRGVFNGSADAKVDAEVIIAQPTAPVSMVTEPIRRQARVAVSPPADAAAQQQAAQQQQQ